MSNENTAPTFIEKYAQALTDFSFLSRTAGSRSDYIQGGGGNTSCKLDDQLMAIKASGFRLDQVVPNHGYAILDYADLLKFYGGTKPADLEDVEKAGSEAAKAATRVIDGLPSLRPSVEAGFHSLLDKFVLHSHSVYANLLTCTAEGQELAAEIMGGLGEDYVFVPYMNPGAQLTFTISEVLEKAAAAHGKRPAVIFMQNHGLITTAPEAQACLDLHDRVNAAIAARFQIDFKAWPDIQIQPALSCTGDDQSAAFKSATPWLSQHLLETTWDLEFFTLHALYPDQLVFLADKLAIVETGNLASFSVSGTAAQAKALLFRETGEILYFCSQNEAQTIEETIAAILFIYEVVKNNGKTISLMNDAGKDFISNWESEKYRQSIAAR